jgi:hypothetical protein
LIGGAAAADSLVSSRWNNGSDPTNRYEMAITSAKERYGP